MRSANDIMTRRRRRNNNDDDEAVLVGGNDHQTTSGGSCCCEDDSNIRRSQTTPPDDSGGSGRTILCTSSASSSSSSSGDNGGGERDGDDSDGNRSRPRRWTTESFWPPHQWRRNRSATVASDFPTAAATISRQSSYRGPRSSMRRRTSMPSELEDPEDMTIGIDPEEYEEEDEYDNYDEEGSATPTTIPTKDERSESISRLSTLPKELRNLIAGGIAGMVAKSFVAPLDRIKILYQVTDAKFSLRALPRDARTIIKNEGWSALWKGNTATMIRVVPYSGIQFMVFDRCKAFYLKQHTDGPIGSGGGPHTGTKYGLTPKESLIAGMVAGTVSASTTYPLDLARAQLAVLRKHTDGSHSTSLREILSENYDRRGIPGLYRGISVTLTGILPYAGIAFALNEQAKREIQHIAGRDVTTIERLQCGAFAGLVAQTITYPIEVVRRRMQTLGIVANNDTAFNNIGAGVKVSTTTATSLVEPPATAPAAAATTATTSRVPSSPPTLANTIRSLYLEQGVRGFFKGVAVNWMKGPVAFSISFTTYDYIQKLMESEYEQQARNSAGYRR